MYTSSDFFIPGVTPLAGTSAGTTLPTTPNFRIQGDNQLFGLAQIPEGAMNLKMNMAAALMGAAVGYLSAGQVSFTPALSGALAGVGVSNLPRLLTGGGLQSALLGIGGVAGAAYTSGLIGGPRLRMGRFRRMGA